MSPLPTSSNTALYLVRCSVQLQRRKILLQNPLRPARKVAEEMANPTPFSVELYSVFESKVQQPISTLKWQQNSAMTPLLPHYQWLGAWFNLYHLFTTRDLK